MWSRTRLRHLRPWTAALTLPQMFAGVEGRGAEDAAYESAVVTEWCKLAGEAFSGGSADIYKCFDQVARAMVRNMISKAGIPE